MRSKVSPKPVIRRALNYLIKLDFFYILGGMLVLEAKIRDKKESVEDLRKEGKIPAVFYGKKTASTPISLSRKDFIKVWREAGESTVVTIKSGADSFDTLINDVDMDPITDDPRHAD